MTKNEINSKEYSKKNFSLKRFKNTSTGNIPVLLPVESHKEITSSKLSRKLSKLCKKEDPCRYYTDLVNVSEESFSTTYKARSIQQMDKVVTIKRICFKRRPRRDLVLQEIQVCQEESLGKYLVTHLESFLWKKQVWIVMEYMEGGNLTDVISHNTNFGFCAHIDKPYSKRRTMAGTLCWRAPALKNPERLSSNLRNFLHKCLQVDAEKRSKAYELLDHPFFYNVDPLDSLIPLIRQTKNQIDML
ncbi:signal transducing kinase of the PAK [Rhizopus stolonifer]|uniref:Signal transducing kinase of the PAK n=1 Tax=Rhizopus stolonifer TaxID=4846 RepID=A0A367KXY5_RHIST|nr:signal transducing kinase of the PAK [Rhizopus stolonifer]